VTESAGPGTSGGRAGTSGRALDGLFLAVSAGVVAVVIGFNALNVFHERAEAGRPVAFWEPLVWEGSSGVLILALLPLILAYTRRVWPLDPPYSRKVLLHLPAAVIFSLIHVSTMGPLRALIYRLAGARYDAAGPITDWPYELRKDLLVYALLVGAYVATTALRSRAAPVLATDDTLEVRDGARRRFIPVAEIRWVEAAGNYVELHTEGGAVLHRAALAEMEKRLVEAGFLRIHRSRLVRRAEVAEVESKPAGDFVVRLRDGRELAGSRRYRRPLLPS